VEKLGRIGEMAWLHRLLKNGPEQSIPGGQLRLGKFVGHNSVVSTLVVAIAVSSVVR
jgi:hypothetical protein